MCLILNTFITKLCFRNVIMFYRNKDFFSTIKLLMITFEGILKHDWGCYYDGFETNLF